MKSRDRDIGQSDILVGTSPYPILSIAEKRRVKHEDCLGHWLLDVDWLEHQIVLRFINWVLEKSVFAPITSLELKGESSLTNFTLKRAPEVSAKLVHLSSDLFGFYPSSEALEMDVLRTPKAITALDQGIFITVLLLPTETASNLRHWLLTL